MSELPAEHVFSGLQERHYRCILNHPPWHFNCGLGKRSRHPSHHYRTMSIKDIAAMPVADLAHPEGARLFLWATMPFLPQALDVVKGWGFRYSTSRVWVKVWPKNANPPWDERSFTHGSGYEVIGNPEPLIIAKIGKPPGASTPRPKALIVAPRREHSRKPESVGAEIERKFAGPYCEIFARKSRPGWDNWGNETAKFDLPLLEVAA